MRLKINQLTRYHYTVPVVLTPHIIRLRPRSDAAQTVLSFEQRIEPTPAGTTYNIDLDGSPSSSAWFLGSINELSIETTSVVETLRPNPFDYVWQGDNSLPLHYSRDITPALRTYLGGATSPVVRNLALRVSDESERNAERFPVLLARTLRNEIRYLVRAEGEARPATVTLAHGEGSCRDIAAVFMAVCRVQGYAARFVSGYFGGDDETVNELHAWVELYMPGGGWRGFDPTLGFAVADRHVALAAAARPQDAAPVSGTFYGSAASILETEVSVKVLAESDRSD